MSNYYENEKAQTKILDVLKFESKYDEDVFRRLPLTDRQKEQILFDMLPELNEYKNIFGCNTPPLCGDSKPDIFKKNIGRNIKECQEKKTISPSSSNQS
jgi:hypothetical protein